MKKLIENLKELNSVELQIVKSTQGSINVYGSKEVSGSAASMCRYVYLTKVLGVAAEGILFLTKDDHKALNLRNELNEKFDSDIETDFVLSMDELYEKILREEISQIGYPSKFKILDSFERREIIYHTFQKYGRNPGARLLLNEFEEAILKFKKDHSYIVNLLTNQEIDSSKPTMYEVNLYLNEQYKRKVLDQVDLQHVVNFIFNNFPEIKEKWKRKFAFIQVDYAESLNKSEHKFLLDLAHHNSNMLHCIYGSGLSTIESNDLSFYASLENIFWDENYTTITLPIDETKEIEKEPKVQDDKPKQEILELKQITNELDRGNEVFKLYDSIEHIIWGKGEIVEVDSSNNFYAVLFAFEHETNDMSGESLKTIPLNSYYSGITKTEHSKDGQSVCILMNDKGETKIIE